MPLARERAILVELAPRTANSRGGLEQVTYFSAWQPLVDENAHTALTFGFLRHAPPDHALEPWLSRTLGRAVKSAPLETDAFWPLYDSVVPGSRSTEPELVFAVDDGQPLTVVIEAKLGYGQQRKEQVAREVVDTAHATGAERVACVMVGADLGPPMDLSEWHDHVAQELRAHVASNVESELRYASWASLGLAAKRCGEQSQAWKRYADDVAEQLHINVLMGYDGAPPLEGIEGGLTIANAAELYRRTIEAGRQFFLALHGQPRFKELGLAPHWGSHRILRDGLSESPSAGAAYFETTVLLALYRLPDWPKTSVVFASIYLAHDESPELATGAGEVTEHGETMVYRWAHADEPHAPDDLGTLAQTDKGSFPLAAVYGPSARWVYDTTPWVAGRPDEDLAWVIGKLEGAVAAWASLTGNDHR